MDYFANNIKYLRLLKGLTQAQICEDIGFAQAAWSEYEHGRTKPRFTELKKIITYYDIPATLILEIDLSKYDLNAILKFRNSIKKYDPKYDPRHDLSPEKWKARGKKKASEPANDPTVITAISRLEKELKELRSKLGG